MDVRFMDVYPLHSTINLHKNKKLIIILNYFWISTGYYLVFINLKVVDKMDTLALFNLKNDFYLKVIDENLQYYRVSTF